MISILLGLIDTNKVCLNEHILEAGHDAFSNTVSDAREDH